MTRHSSSYIQQRHQSQSSQFHKFVFHRTNASSFKYYHSRRPFTMCFPVQTSVVKKSGSASAPIKRSFLDDSFPTFTVPTFREKPTESIEVSDLTPSEIASLKKKDPFMYYSIPAARKSAMKAKEFDPSLLAGDASSSCSSSTEEGSRKSRKVSQKVTKQRRLSMEMHPDALMDELLNDAEFMSTISQSSGSDASDFDFEDSLLSLFAELSK